MKISTMFKSLVVISAIGSFCSLAGYAAGKYGVFEPQYQTAKMKGKRLNCQDLGLCNLRTGEVYDRSAMKPEVADAIVYLYDPEGNAI